MQPRCRRALLPSAPSCREIVGFSFYYYFFFSWTRRVKSDILSRAGPQPLLLCNCCSGGTGPARSRPPSSFRAEGFFPHHPPPSGSGVCVCVHRRSAPTSSSSQPLQRAWPTCLLHFPGGDTDPDLPVPSLFLLTGFFPTCTSGYCGTTAGGGWGAAPRHPATPRLVPVPLLLWKAWAPKVLYVFIVTLYGYVK